MRKPPLKTDGECCPYCGSTDGFMYKLYQTGTQYMQWDGKPSHYTDGDGRHGVHRCMSCGKQVTAEIT